MPIYEYQCRECKYKFEVYHKVNDPRLLHCVKCNKFSLERIISKNTFILRGEGWTGKLN